MDDNTYIKLNDLFEKKRQDLIEKLTEFANIPGGSEWTVREKAYIFLDNIDKIDKYLAILKKVFDGQ